MARVTVEDCIEKVKNRFELVLMAAQRAKDIERGATPSIPRDNDKPTIIALREIAEETISLSGLKELTKRGLIEDKGLFINMSENEEEFPTRNDEDLGELFEGESDTDFEDNLSEESDEDFKDEENLEDIETEEEESI